MRSRTLENPVIPPAPTALTEEIFRSLNIGILRGQTYRSSCIRGLGRIIGGEVVPDESTFSQYYIDDLDLTISRSFEDICIAIVTGHNARLR